jgi:hypothetical protein
MSRFILSIALLAVPCLLLAGEDSQCSYCQCQHCGCQAHCQKFCHVVCEWKDVKETVYTCRCTDVCIPGRSEKECTKIDQCNPDNCPLLHDYKPLYTLWNPSECARIRPVTKLVKLQVTHKVPTYKWVVEYCCDKCRCEITQNETPEEKLAAGPQPKLQSEAVVQASAIETASVPSSSLASPAEALDPRIFLPDYHPAQPRLLPGTSNAAVAGQ